MNDVALVPVSWIRTIAFAAALAIAGVFFLGRCTAPAARPLPARVAARIVEHQVRTVIDSARVQQLEATIARLRDTASRVAEAGLAAHRRADELQAAAIAAMTLADSARLWRMTALERQREADSAWRVVALRDAEIMQTDSILDVETARADRADALLAEVVPLATGDDGCRILWVFGCPSRKAVAIGSAIAGAGAVYVGRKIVRGEIRIRLPIG
jgi:hypothetical protein